MKHKDQANKKTRLPEHQRPALKCKVGIWSGTPRQWWRPKDVCTIPKWSGQKLRKRWLAWSRRASRACSTGAGPVSWRRELLFSTSAKLTSPSFLVSQKAVRLSWPLRGWIKGKQIWVPLAALWASAQRESAEPLIKVHHGWFSERQPGISQLQTEPGKPAKALLDETRRWGPTWMKKSIQGSSSLSEWSPPAEGCPHYHSLYKVASSWGKSVYTLLMAEEREIPGALVKTPISFSPAVSHLSFAPIPWPLVFLIHIISAPTSGPLLWLCPLPGTLLPPASHSLPHSLLQHHPLRKAFFNHPLPNIS